MMKSSHIKLQVLSEGTGIAQPPDGTQKIFLRKHCGKHVLYFPRNTSKLPKDVIPHSTLPVQGAHGGSAQKLLAYQITKQCEYYAIRLPLLRGGLRRLPFTVALPPQVFLHPSLQLFSAMPQQTETASDDCKTEDKAEASKRNDVEPTFTNVLTWARPVKTGKSIAATLNAGLQSAAHHLETFKEKVRTDTSLSAQPDALILLQHIQSIFFHQFDFLQTQLLIRPISQSQRYNHWPGSAAAIGDKKGLQQNIDQFARNLRRKAPLSAKQLAKVPFVIPTYCLPQQKFALKKAVALNKMYPPQKRDLWIVKPARGSCGRGIFICSEGDNRFQAILKGDSGSVRKNEEAAYTQSTTSLQDQPQKSATGSDCVVQKYIANPLLYNGYKFDMRLYVLVTSIDPFVCYRFPEGMVRFAAEPYNHSGKNRVPCAPMDKFSHLTNYSVGRKYLQKICQLLQPLCEEPIEPADLPASWAPKLKMRLSEFSTWLSGALRRRTDNHITYKEFDAKVNELILSTLFASKGKLMRAIKQEDAFWTTASKGEVGDTRTFGDWMGEWKRMIESLQNLNVDCAVNDLEAMQPLKKYVQDYTCTKPSQTLRRSCFELYGFDIMVDDNCEPLLIEVNVLPSLESSSGLDYELKNAVLTDLLNLMCFPFDTKGSKDSTRIPKRRKVSIEDRFLQETSRPIEGDTFQRIFPTRESVQRFRCALSLKERREAENLVESLQAPMGE